MAPILIDSRGLIKLGLFSLLAVGLVFFAGFFSGYEQASTVYATKSEIKSLVLPVKPGIKAGDLDVRTPEKMVAGEDIDVDQPDATSSRNNVIALKTENLQKKPPFKVKNVTDTHTGETLHTTEVQISHEVADKKVSVISAPMRTSATKSETDPIGSDRVDTGLNNTTTNKQTEIKVAALSAEELNKIKYSVQVGMYGRLVNAENMVNMLKAKQLNAYVSDYTNKKNQIRYNVRFGYYKDKKAALSALKKYNNSEQGDGYLVRFSFENITKLADARYAADTVKAQESTEHTDLPADTKSSSDVETPSPV